MVRLPAPSSGVPVSFTITLSDLQALVVGTFGATAAVLVLTIVLVRLYGLRSLAKFAPHDFVATVAMGSVIAATAARSVSLPAGLLGLGAIFAVQWVVSRVRRAGGTTVVDNDPLILMAADLVLWEHMEEGGVTVADLRAKLREANVIRLDEVRAVILEGTGDISVLHTRDDTTLDPVLIEGVRGVDDVEPPDTWRPAERDEHPFER